MTAEISVIIRSLGRPCLTEAITSVMNQTTHALEIIIVDAKGSHHPPLPDFSSDVTLRLVSTGKPLSRSAAANIGMEATNGDLLIFLDDDDLFLEKHLSGLQKTLATHPEAVASYAGIRVIDAVGNEIDVYNAPYEPTELLGHNLFPIHAVLFRRAFSLDCHFDETLDVYEDWDFWLQLTRKGPFVHHDAVTAIYRVALGNSGLSIEANENLRQMGRALIYQKWRRIWSGAEWNAHIESNQKRLTVFERERIQLKGHISQVEYALENTRQHLSHIENAYSQLENIHTELNNTHDRLKTDYSTLADEKDQLKAERDQLEQDRNYYYERFREIENSTFWRITAPLRFTIIFLKTLRNFKNSVWDLIRFSFHKIPVSELTKRQVQDWAYQRFPQIFSHLPSYNFRVHGIIHHFQKSCSTTRPPLPIVSLEEILPACESPASLMPQGLLIDVIIPIYDGITTTSRCLESVLGAKVHVDHRIILIDDASPRPEICALLDAIPQSERILVLRHTQNRGFTATVNHGMSLSTGNDVVLLNSDTEVPDAWLDRLVYHAYRSSQIGTVTPFSNNATVCSYPNLPGRGTLPDGETLVSLDRTIQDINRGRQTDLPTAIGFCMYIKRDCLRDVGLFDEKTFGRGYGEENDFCLRANRQGWRHVLAADLFVFHAGEVSFGAESSSSKLRAMALLRQRYPDYEARIADHVERDPARPWRLAVTAARLRRQNHPVVLMISHGLGGGVDKHIQDLSRILTDAGAKVLILRSLPERYEIATLEFQDPVDGFAVCLPLKNEARLADVIEAFGVRLTHIHHTMHWSIDLQALLARLGRPFLFTVHDYYSLCPRVNLMGPAHPAYCGEPDIVGCLDCLRQFPRAETTDIVNWRIRHAWLFQDARAIICPSQDTVQRCLKYYPAAGAKMLAVPHETPLANLPALHHPVTPNRPLRVAILGVVARHKGLVLVLELARLIFQQRSTIQLVVIGYCAESIPETLSRVISQTGPYEDRDLPRLILEAQPHLIWFPARWPETYSYTLTAALVAGIPILAPRLGAFTERLQNQPLAWLHEIDASSTDLFNWLDQFHKLRLRNAWPLISALPIASFSPLVLGTSWYATDYLAMAESPVDSSPFDLRGNHSGSIVVVPELLEQHPSPCGYIRLLLPLAASIQYSTIRFASPAAALYYRSSVFFTQRLAFRDLATVDTFLQTLRSQGSRLVYDLDDDLLELHDGHYEATAYRRSEAVVKSLIQAADEVWLSTRTLAERARPINPRVRVIPNQLDNRLWRLLETEFSDKENIRLLYMGTKTHRHDWMMVEPALKRIRQRHGQGVEMHIVGIDEPDFLPSWAIVHEPPPGLSAIYPAFVGWLQSLGPFEIGIAPLTTNSFNLAKSGIKFMDYTALGAVTVASDLPPYQDVIRHEDNGILVANSSADHWEQAIESLIAHPEKRQSLWRHAQRDWLLHHRYHSDMGHDALVYLMQFAESLTSERPSSKAIA